MSKKFKTRARRRRKVGRQDRSDLLGSFDCCGNSSRFCAGEDVYVKLSSNFSFRELTKSQTAERKGIDNTPTEEHTENLKLLCENILQPTRDEWGVVSVSSGYRSPALCVAIGSSEKSQHARGMAADFECHSVDNKELFDWVTSNLDYDQAILEFYTGTPESGWLHVSYNKDGNRKQRLRAFRNDAGKTQYEEI